MNRDFELPNGFQDADLEMAELTASANRISRLRKRGICTHGWVQGPPGPAGKPTSIWTCHDCGKTFQSEAELDEARAELLS